MNSDVIHRMTEFEVSPGIKHGLSGEKTGDNAITLTAENDQGDILELAGTSAALEELLKYWTEVLMLTERP